MEYSVIRGDGNIIKKTPTKTVLRRAENEGDVLVLHHLLNLLDLARRHVDARGEEDLSRRGDLAQPVGQLAQ